VSAHVDTSTPARPNKFPAARLETLGDGVFAIAMTVLVLGIQVPDVGRGQLLEHLGTLWPKFASYALSFVMLGVLWIGHYYQFQYIRRTDRKLIWLNLFFLLSVTFLPFGAGVLGNTYEDPVAVVLYGGTILAAGTALLLHWNHAVREPDLSPGVPAIVVTSLRGRIIIGLVFSAVAMGLGFVDTRISLVVFLSMPFVYMRRSRLERERSA
jgi:uncharacterized membrane protein